MNQTPSAERIRELARLATRAALTGYALPDAARQRLVLGEEPTRHHRIFLLYLPGERPEDAVVLTRVAVDIRTGAVGPVEIDWPPDWPGPTTAPTTDGPAQT